MVTKTITWTEMTRTPATNSRLPQLAAMCKIEAECYNQNGLKQTKINKNMKPIFTIHAGEYLVAAEIEKRIKNVNIWLPSKDKGIDLLLTDKSNKKTVSIQVKYSKDFNTTHVKENLRKNIKGMGWWTLDKGKLEESQADYWVFIIYSLERKTHDYIIIEPQKLLDIFKKLKRVNKTLHCYFTVTTANKAFETRGLKKKEMKELYEGKYTNEERDVSTFLNNWKPITDKLK